MGILDAMDRNENSVIGPDIVLMFLYRNCEERYLNAFKDVSLLIISQGREMPLDDQLGSRWVET